MRLTVIMPESYPGRPVWEISPVPGPLELRFVLSADKLEALPDSPAEVAVVGRSNVGKSSLINALANRTRLAETSKTPGRTRLLNCFVRPDGTTFVDCPGYGYAAASKAVRSTWPAMIERYLVEREPLTMILVLVDGEIGPTKLDLQMLEWLRSFDRPFTVVATKHDKVRPSKRDRRKKEVAEAVGSGVVWVSAAKGTGIDRLRGLVVGWLGDTQN
jgi:GTP-binding protein